MNQLIFLFCSILFTSQIALAWGERGHHAVGYTATLLVQDYFSIDEQKLAGSCFRERPHQMGHLSNIPDFSWKDSRRETVVKFNRPTHYFDAEVLLGLPTDNKNQPTTKYSSTYLDKVRNIERDFEKLRLAYDGKPNPLPGAEGKNKTINLYFNVGTAPWRVQELYDSMAEAFRCASSKPKLDKKSRKPFVSPLKAADTTPLYPYYKCTPKTSRLEDIYAALVFGGVMGHYIGDLSQPHHATSDFDGWTTGQGGLHAYYETFIVHYLPESFHNEVVEKARDTREKTWKKMAAQKNISNFAVQVSLNLAADSMSKLQMLRDIDRKTSLLEESARLQIGSTEGKVDAKRRPFNDPKVLKGYKDFVRDQLAISSVVLSGLWVEAWRDGGSPDIADVNLIMIPYPLDVPFLWPTYSKHYLK